MPIFTYRRCFDPWNKHNDMRHPSCLKKQADVGPLWTGVYESEAVVNKAVQAVTGEVESSSWAKFGVAAIAVGGIYLYTNRSRF